MRKYIVLSNNPGIHELYREFRISQENLYHYTCDEAATSISKTGVLWLTRADCFLDETEVSYGAGILREAIELEVTGDKQEFISLVGDLEESLRQCYVFSASSNPSNSYLLKNYGEKILELREGFPFCLSHSAWHSLPNGDGFNIYHFIELYESVEGYIVYDKNEQVRIARKVIVALCQLFGNDIAQMADVFHVRQLLVTCIVLFKHGDYSGEEEYRVVLHRLVNRGDLNFDNARNSKGKEIAYIKASVAQFNQDCLVSIRSAE